MRVLLLNGASPGDAALDAAHLVLLQTFVEVGWAHHSVALHELPLAWCVGCFECWTRTPGVCRTQDGVATIAQRLVQSDLLVLLTPITFGGYSSHLKKALDRMIGLVSPAFMRSSGETRHRPRYERYPALLALGLLDSPDPDDERTFHTLVHRHAVNFHAPRFASRVLYRDDPPARSATLLLDYLQLEGRAA